MYFVIVYSFMFLYHVYCTLQPLENVIYKFVIIGLFLLLINFRSKSWQFLLRFTLFNLLLPDENALGEKKNEDFFQQEKQNNLFDSFIAQYWHHLFIQMT